MSERAVDLCVEAKREYDPCTEFLQRWEWLHLALGAATVILIIIGMVLISAQLSTEAAITAGLSLATGGAALWFTRQLASYRKRQEEAWNRMVEHCSEREVINLLMARAAQARRRYSTGEPFRIPVAFIMPLDIEPDGCCVESCTLASCHGNRAQKLPMQYENEEASVIPGEGSRAMGACSRRAISVSGWRCLNRD